MKKRRRSKSAPRAPYDWYCEDEAPVHALFDFYAFDFGTVYDPCCGRGNIPEVARSRGFPILASDLVDRGYSQMARTGDFLDPGFSASPVGKPAHIVFNPPYSYVKGICEAMIRRAFLVAGGTVAALVSTDFLHSLERQNWFENEHPPTIIAYLSARPSMPPGHLVADLGDDAFRGGKTNYVWLIWELATLGAPTRRVAWLGKPDVSTSKKEP